MAFLSRLRENEKSLPVFFLFAVIFIVFGLPIILGYSLLPSYPTPSVFPSGFYHEPVRSPAGDLSIDPGGSLQILPWDKMAGDALKKGNIPLWNPYSLTGIPFLANIQSAFLFPLQTLQDIMPSYMWSVMYMVRFFAAGSFTFLFLRRVGLQPLAAVSGALLYVLSGSVVLYFRLEPAFNSDIMLPVVLYFFERLYGSWSRKNLLWAALSFSFLVVSGQPEISIINALFAGSYSFFRGWQKHAEGCKKGEAFGPLTMYPMGILMAMPLLMSVWEYFQNTDPGRAGLGKMYLNARIMVFQVIPQLLGHAGHYISPGAKAIFSWNYIGGYTGVIGAYLVILGILSRGEKAFNDISKFMMIAAGILLMKIYGFPPLQWLGALPVLKHFWITRYSGAALTMSFATVAAVGTQEILTNTNTEVRQRAFIATLILIAILLSPVTGLITAKLNTLVLGSLAITTIFMGLLWFLIVRQNTGREAFAVIILLSAELMVLTQFGLKPGVELLRIASVFILSSGVIIASEGKRLAAGLLVIVSITAMSASFIISKKGPPVNRDLFRGSSFITFLKERQLNNYERAFSLDGFLTGNFHSAFGIYGLNVCEALVPGNVNEFAKRYLDPHANPVFFDGDNGFRTGGSAREALLTYKKYYDLIGARYIVTSPEKGLNDSGMVRIYNNEAQIWENAAAYPRAFVVSDVKVSGSTKDALDMMGTLDLRDQAVITSKESGFKVNNPGRGLSPTEVKIREMSAQKIVLAIENPQKGRMLVITDTYYPGWVAKVDGDARPIYEADGAFRGIFLEKGDKEIVLEYKPRSFFYGTGVSIASIFCCLIPWRRFRGGVPI